MPRFYTRKFDWEEARRLRAEGVPTREIAKRFGVTYNAVFRVVSPGRMEREAAYKRRWEATGRCDDCGGPMNQASRSPARGSRRCVSCASTLRRTSVTADMLQCVTCREWKPDADFPLNRGLPARRDRHRQCRACCTAARRDYRNRHKVPCATGCGRLVLAPNEQEASARQKGSTATGMCRSCASRLVQLRKRGKLQALTSG